AVLGTVGTSGCEPAEKPPGGPRSNWDIWAVGMCGTRKVDSAEKGKKLPKSLFRTVGTVGKKVRERRGSAGLAQVIPFQAVQRNLSQAIWDSWDKSTRRMQNGWFGRNRELSFGTSGPK
ncbi:hypothetical protein KI387_043404, partial [Taxus chinensis]